MRVLRCVVAVSLGLALSGCGSDPSEQATTSDATESGTGAPDLCAAGQVRACNCAGGPPAQQSCIAPGEWGACECGGPSTTSSTGDTDPTEGDLCGDGVEDADEQCDDGNGVDDDDCSNDCVPHCGLMWSTPLAGDRPTPSFDGGEAQVVYLALDADAVVPTWARLALSDGTVEETESLAPAIDAGAGQAILRDRVAYLFGSYAVDGDAAAARVTRYDVPTGLIWDIATPDDLIFDSFGITTTIGGDPIVAGEIPVVDGDTDVWVAKYSRVDGSEVWTTTHSGPLDMGFSLDEAGPVATANDGDVFVLGRLRKSFNRIDATLVRFGGDGGVSEWEDVAVVDPGDNNELQVDALATGPGGAVAAGVTIYRSGSSLFNVVRYEAETRAFVVDETMLAVDGADLGDVRLAFDGEQNLVVVGSRDVGGAAEPVFQIFVARYDPAGAELCSAGLTLPGFATRVVTDANGEVLVGGAQDGESWIARIRP